MMRTKAVLGRALLAAGLSVAAGAAHAVPIIFDFTGTVSGGTRYDDFVNQVGSTDLSTDGQVVTGQIVIETDGLLRSSQSQTNGTRISYDDAITDAADLFTSKLFIAGVEYDVGLHSGDNGRLSAFDSSGVPNCIGCTPAADSLSLFDSSSDHWSLAGSPPPPPGQYYSRRLSLTWQPADGRADFIDSSSGIEALDFVSLIEGLVPTGRYSELTLGCEGLMCTIDRAVDTRFTISSLTAHTPSVPEPGTLALFAAGLLGAGFARRSLMKGPAR